MDEELTNAEISDLYRRYGFFLRRRCLVLLRNTALADDALQETFLKVIARGGALRTVEHPLRWLYRVTDHACFDLLRRTKHTQRAVPFDGDVALSGYPGTQPELRRAAIELLEALDDEEATIAVMAFIDGMTQQEIATELGYSRMTIVKRVASIRDRAEKVSGEYRASAQGAAS